MKTNGKRPTGGFTLIEVMVSMAILAIGVLGAAQVQVLASSQNSIARRTQRAAQIARDFAETAQRWEYTDPRLAPVSACGTAVPIVTEAALGIDRAPAMLMDYTATLVSGSNAASEGSTKGALGLGPYDGNARRGVNDGLLGKSEFDRYQLTWSVAMVDMGTAVTGCEGKQVTVVVRYPIGPGPKVAFRSLITTFVKYDNSALAMGGISELF